MKIIIEVSGGIVVSAYSNVPEDMEVVIQDFDDIRAGSEDPFDADPTLADMRGPQFRIY